jgi:hypothetical protein
VIQFLLHSCQFLPVLNQSSSVVHQLSLNVVPHVEGLLHHSHSVLELIGGVGEQVALLDEFGLVTVVLLNKYLFTSNSAPISIYLFLSKA